MVSRIIKKKHVYFNANLTKDAANEDRDEDATNETLA